jgi:hypothetical protein
VSAECVSSRGIDDELRLERGAPEQHAAEHIFATDQAELHCFLHWAKVERRRNKEPVM